MNVVQYTILLYLYFLICIYTCFSLVLVIEFCAPFSTKCLVLVSPLSVNVYVVISVCNLPFINILCALSRLVSNANKKDCSMIWSTEYKYAVILSAIF